MNMGPLNILASHAAMTLGVQLLKTDHETYDLQMHALLGRSSEQVLYGLALYDITFIACVDCSLTHTIDHSSLNSMMLDRHVLSW